MATFALIHGAGGRASYWDLVCSELASAGHDSVAMDLPCEDDAAGLTEYADAVFDAIGTRRNDLVLVAQSLAGFTAPLVAERLDVAQIVLVTAMIPAPGETGGEWWANTGHAEAVSDEDELFVQDVPADVLAAAGPPRGQSGTPLEEVWPLPAWPDISTRFLLCMDDRFFPPEWMRGIVRDRLGIEPDEIPGGHCAFLSQPKPMADALVRGWHDR